MEFSGNHERSEAIDQAMSIKSIIGACKNSAEYENAVRGIIRAYKQYFDAPAKYSIPLYWKGESIGKLRPVPTKLKNAASRDAELQTDWRNLHKDSFIVEPFVATVERTIGWLERTYFRNDDVIIFIIEAIDGAPIGHIGFSNFDYAKRICEQGRLLRGAVAQIENEKGVNLMLRAEMHLLQWGFDVLGLEMIYGSQFAANYFAWSMNKKCGFYITDKYKITKCDGEHEMMRIEVTKDTFVFE